MGWQKHKEIEDWERNDYEKAERAGIALDNSETPEEDFAAGRCSMCSAPLDTIGTTGLCSSCQHMLDKD